MNTPRIAEGIESLTNPWWVYVLASTVRTVTYVGCTNDVARRVRQHNGELSGGARFTRNWRPWVIGAVYGPFNGRGEAQRAERRVKRLRGTERLRWREGSNG